MGSVNLESWKACSFSGEFDPVWFCLAFRYLPKEGCCLEVLNKDIRHLLQPPRLFGDTSRTVRSIVRDQGRENGA